MLQFFSASTNVVNSKRAIAECLENALEGQGSLDCDLLIIYTGIGHNFRELLSEAHRLAPGARVVGCTGAGTIGREGPEESLKALAIMAVKGPQSEFAVTGVESVVDRDVYEIGRGMASDLKNQNPGISMILFNPSTDLVSGQQVLEGIESVFGPDIPVIGGGSIDNMKLISNFQFLGEQIFEKGAVMIGFADPTLEMVCQANHGFDILDNSFQVTRSDKSCIYELDGKPAWKAWTERLGMPVSAPLADVLVLAPLATELPEYLREGYGSSYLINGAMNYPDGKIKTVLEYKVGSRIWLARRNDQKIQEGVERMMVQILDRCKGRKPVAVFHTDCAARGKFLFNRIMKEELISQMQYPLCKGENIPWLGIYGGFEYTPLLGKNRLHQYTTSLYVLVRKKLEPAGVKVELRPEIAAKSRLFEKTAIRNLDLKNRFIFSATCQGKANFDGAASPTLISSLLQVARGGAALIITEMAYVSANSASVPGQLGIYSDTLLPGLQRMTEFVHREGARIIVQLVQGGLFAAPMLTGATPFGPSPLETPDGIIGREMSAADIAGVVDTYREAAIRAKKAGFDGVQIHVGHGWLLNEFLSPSFNRRTDEYGGSLENRARIALDITRTIREAVGNDFAIFAKINSDDFIPGGFNTGEMLGVSAMLEQAGVDAIEVSGGTVGALLAGDLDNSFSPTGKKGVYYREAARLLKENIKLPVILVGGIRTFEDANELFDNKIADYISLCRPLIREPGLISRWESGDPGKSECISDSACFQPGFEGKGVHCIHVNLND